MPSSSKNKCKNTYMSVINYKSNKSNKNIIKNFTCSLFENLIINKNFSSSSKKEKINNSPSLKKINNTKKTILINNLNSKINNNKISEILTTILKGIISLKKNDLFDYILKMLKIILYYYKGNKKINLNDYNQDFNLDDSFLYLLYRYIFQALIKGL